MAYVDVREGGGHRLSLWYRIACEVRLVLELCPIRATKVPNVSKCINTEQYC